MECNKDEANRAKQIAEMKMKANDFEGARKIALKAQNLYPELENITQLLSICDVHCSAQKRMLGAEKDWYGILQVEKYADELTVKKQYRRLALFLHPDKNRFPGAEAAFKLICEANAVLSDPTKKSSYDTKIKTTGRYAPVNPPPHSQFNKQFGAQNNVPNGFSSLNQRQAAPSSFSIRQEVFWTSCPFCSVKYTYDRKYVNTTLTCQKCLKNFMGYEISGQGVPVGSKWVPPTAHKVPLKPGVSQHAAFQERAVPNQGKFTMGVQNNMGSSASQAGSQWTASAKTVRPESGVPKGTRVESAAKVSGDTKDKKVDNCNVNNSSHGRNEGGAYTGDANNRETGNVKNKSRKRGRKRVVESSESCDTSSESDLEDVTINVNRDPASDLNSHGSFVRRSSRKRQNVSYKEGDDDDDYLPNPLKRSQGSEVPGDNENEQNDDLGGENSKIENQNGFPTYGNQSKSESNEMGTAHPEKSLRHKGADLDKEVKGRGDPAGMSGNGADAIVIESDSDQDSYPRDNPDKDICNCDDPEFNDFDKDRDESCFSVNQFWACYDSADGMPRFYAKVKKFCASPFELSITWLEADPIDEAHEKWMQEELPVGCGSFKLGKTEKTSLRLSFSHLVHCEKGKKRGSLIIYPREGEVWALFKDWDLSWSSSPDSHREFKYEIVEVLSNFVAVDGVKVCYLNKISDFVSLFQRSSEKETNSFLIGPNELYRFSHRIPCYKMTGSERVGVPAGSFELDPAALPLNPDDLYYPGKAKMETKNMDSGVNRAPPKSA